jgi:cyclopropane-fatty-acyl-phospholipid synthase
MSGAADAIAEFASPIFGGRLPVRIHCWDGSAAGPLDAVAVHLRSPDALRYMIWSPGQLGVARAYVTGNLDVEGDFSAGLDRAIAAAAAGRRAGQFRWGPAMLARGVKLVASLGAIGRPLPAPASEARPTGRLHSRRRDAEVISHHYDLSNDFYTLLLDDAMAYSCGYWTDDDPSYTVADAQRDKLDLICRKLDLRPGARLLDLGCGWGSLTIHAAKYYGATVTAITVAKEQAEFVRGRIETEEVGHLVDLRWTDYRDIVAAEGPGHFDAVAAVEMGEHVGAAGYLPFLAGLHAVTKDEGRLLIQVMSRGRQHPGGGPFIERYIAPDMHMRPLYETLGLIQSAGFEVRDVHALREHYGRTIRAWHAEMERRWDEVVGLIGEERARVWRLYMAGGALSFEANRMGVDQILSVKPAADGRSGMAATRLGWEQPSEAVRGAR